MRYSAEPFHPTEGGAEEGEMGCQEGEANSDTSRTQAEDQERSYSSRNNTPFIVVRVILTPVLLLIDLVWVAKLVVSLLACSREPFAWRVLS